MGQSQKGWVDALKVSEHFCHFEPFLPLFCCNVVGATVLLQHTGKVIKFHGPNMIVIDLFHCNSKTCLSVCLTVPSTGTCI